MKTNRKKEFIEFLAIVFVGILFYGIPYFIVRAYDFGWEPIYLKAAAFCLLALVGLIVFAVKRFNKSVERMVTEQVARGDKRLMKNQRETIEKFEHKKRYITVEQLRRELELLRAGKNKFYSFGFTSNDVGNIYLFTDTDESGSDKFYVQFEPLKKARYQFEKLKKYAEMRRFPNIVITPQDRDCPIQKDILEENILGGIVFLYGIDDMPEIRIEAGADISTTIKLIDTILHNIFGNKRGTKYEAMFMEEEYLT